MRSIKRHCCPFIFFFFFFFFVLVIGFFLFYCVPNMDYLLSCLYCLVPIVLSPLYLQYIRSRYQPVVPQSWNSIIFTTPPAVLYSSEPVLFVTGGKWRRRRADAVDSR